MSVPHGFETDRTTSRPVIRGRRLMVACGHYLGSMAGMRMLAHGGNAVDAGVAAVFAQLVLEFQGAGLGGECPILIASPREQRVVALNGNCRAPAAATIARYRELGFELIPGDGFLSAGVCATPSALITALERYGRLSLAEVLQPAIELAADGFPMYEAFRTAIANSAARFRAEWPSSAALMLLPDGGVPPLGWIYRNPDLAASYQKLVQAEHDARHLGRSAALRAAHDRFYRGDLAERIVEFQRETTTNHTGGPPSAGLITTEDFADFETREESPASVSYRGYTVHKCGPWSQGPVFLQQLNLLEGFDLAALSPGSADLVHTVVEAAKLAFADRERYYGDPDFVRVPLAGLLSKEYAAEQRELIDPARASLELRPGNPYPYDPQGGSPDQRPLLGAAWQGGTTGTRAVDADGLMFSATPSGGWLRSSPVIPGLGFALGSRLQMLWLDPQHPAGLAPRKQPRTTLTPSLVTRDGQPYLAFGTPGGDQQDQWTLQFFLNHVEFGMDIQEALDQPAFHSKHFASSFYPRQAQPGTLVMEASFPAVVRDELRARGHQVRDVRPLSLGNITAVRIDPDSGALEASATCRGQKAYAIGW
jgi:gamma-glutamyltranspeptidase / glutathione hydrolase